MRMRKTFFLLLSGIYIVFNKPVVAWFYIYEGQQQQVDSIYQKLPK